VHDNQYSEILRSHPQNAEVRIAEVWSVILERPWDNPASRVTGELTALVGARVMGEHRHPALVEQFALLERTFERPET
jgi:hypothetical protein